MLQDKEFTQLQIPVLRVKGKDERRYRVYRNKHEFIEIEADTIQEALEKSNIPVPYKVVYHIRRFDGVLDESQLLKDPEV